MDNNDTTLARRYRKDARNWFLLLLIFLLLFLLVGIILSAVIGGPIEPAINEVKGTAVAILAVISLLVMVGAKKRMTSRLNAVTADSSLSVKMDAGRKALLGYIGLMQVPVVLGIVLYLLSADFMYEVFSAIVLGYIASMYPNVQRMTYWLKLSEKEKQSLLR